MNNGPSEAILVEKHTSDRILVATLNRPTAGNAIDWNMAAAFAELAAQVEGSSDVDAVIIAANGRIFCGGGDVRLFGNSISADGGREALSQTLSKLSEAMHSALLRLVNAGPLLVAAVNGPAAGAGFGLVCICDIAFAQKTAVLRAGFSRLGLSADSSTSYFLPRIVGFRKAVEILLGGEPVPAERALALGIYAELIDGTDEPFLDEVIARTRKLIRSGPATCETLALLRAGYPDLSHHLDEERRRLIRLSLRPDVRAYIRATLKQPEKA